MPVQRHSVVIPREDGGVELHALKEWLRQHPEELPAGLDATSSTSHQLRNGLRRLGWTMQETPTEVRLIKPGVASPETIENVLGANELPADNEDEATGAFFSLEYQLRDFIASNLSAIAINGKRLRLYVDPTGRDGIEFPTAVGPIDILAVDESNAFYVFELKRANSSDRAIGQLARYMGWVQNTIGKDSRVFGVIVAKSISENLRCAASIMRDTHLFEYQVEFKLRPAHDFSLK